MTDPTFTLELEDADGGTRTVPVSFDLDKLTYEARYTALERWDGETPSHLAASLLFATTGLPDDEWPAVGPVLQGVIEGDVDNLKVTVYGV